MTGVTADVVVVGGGPVGMVLAAELVLGGVDAVVLERRVTPELAGSRAGGFHARALEILDQRGIVDRFLAEGQTVQALRVAGTTLDLSGFPTRHPYTLGLWQNHTERILRAWIDELGVEVRRGADVVGLAQDDAGVEVRLADGDSLRASYVVGADGGRSVVRREAGIAFEGTDATRSQLIAEVEVTEETPGGIRLDETGIHAMGLLEDGRTVRMVVTESDLGSGEPTLADLSATLRPVFGTDFGIHDPTWISRFTDASRQARTYRAGRVLVAGDAAHVHHPAGGQGLGLGLQDAVNLGWKLALVARGAAPESLLDTYDAERRPAGARTLEHVLVLASLQRGDARTTALLGMLDDLLAYDAPRDHLAGMLSCLDVAYDLGDGHPLLGRRMPDLDLGTADGVRSVYSHLHAARPVLLDLGGPALDVTGWEDRVSRVAASYDGGWELPVIGSVDAPTGVLVRPDGHVAWVGAGSADGLEEALTRWCGPAR